jgi:hypothetical protein
MRLSISIKTTEKGFVPQLVLEVPNSITIIPCGDPCPTFKEAWVVARTMRDIRNEK